MLQKRTAGIQGWLHVADHDNIYLCSDRKKGCLVTFAAFTSWGTGGKMKFSEEIHCLSKTGLTLTHLFEREFLLLAIQLSNGAFISLNLATSLSFSQCFFLSF